MTLALIDAPPGALSADLAASTERVRDYIANSKAPNTVRAYRSDWAHFAAYCSARGYDSLPATPATLALYLSDLAETHRVSTIQRRLAAISQAHALAGHASPSTDARVKELWKGIRRTKGTAPHGKAAATTDIVRTIAAHLPESTLLGLRDRALLLLGFAGAFRRSELVGLDVADVEFTKEGAIVTLRRAKTDQEGEGFQKGIPYGRHVATCPVRALQAWLEATGIAEGPIFRPVGRAGVLGAGRLSDRAVARVVKRGVRAAGLDPALFAGHSLRAGLATSAAAARVPEADIQRTTGHKSVAILRRYVRTGSLFIGNASGSVGL